MEKITSTQNPVIRSLKALKDAKERTKTGLFLVEGEVMIREALKCGLTPKDALFENESPLMSALTKAGANVHLCSRGALEAATDTKTPQGSVCAFTMPRKTSLPDNAMKIVALDAVQDPGNVGTIWRTADAAGFDAVIFGEGCADAYSPKVQRAAMGSGFRVPAVHMNLKETLPLYTLNGASLIVSALDGSDLYARAPIPGDKPMILVIGNEAKGVSKEVQSLSNVRLKIPMRGGAESLNAAVAAGILMYELTK
ncbi:MAG: RNA methyltransferase [Clostridia bacterium]|nr:RNA methyltransferase [Clostridia bacterium]